MKGRRVGADPPNWKGDGTIQVGSICGEGSGEVCKDTSELELLKSVLADREWRNGISLS